MYRLPEDALGAIHFRAIERIYGDSVRAVGCKQLRVVWGGASSCAWYGGGGASSCVVLGGQAVLGSCMGLGSRLRLAALPLCWPSLDSVVILSATSSTLGQHRCNGLQSTARRS